MATVPYYESDDFSWDDVPDSGFQLFPKGYYDAQIAATEIDTFRDGRLRFSVEFRIKAPEQFANQPHFENFIVGTLEDPDAELKETWKNPDNIGASLFKGLAEKTVGLKGNPRSVLEEMEGERLVLGMSKRPGKGKHQGRTFQAVRFFEEGEREIGLVDEDDDDGDRPSPRKAKANGRDPEPEPKRRSRDSDPDDDEPPRRRR